jgi:hypothetical protein
MGKGKHSEAQMIAALKQVEAGRAVEDGRGNAAYPSTPSTPGNRSTAAWT